VVSMRPAMDAAFCSARRGDFGWVDDAHLDHVAVLAVSALKPKFSSLESADLADHNGAFVAGVEGDLSGRLFESAPHDACANGFVIVELKLTRRLRCNGATPSRRRGQCLPRQPHGWRA